MTTCSKDASRYFSGSAAHSYQSVQSDLGESGINSRAQGKDNAACISRKSYFLPPSAASEATSIISTFQLTQFFCKVARWPPTDAGSQAASHRTPPYAGDQRSPTGSAFLQRLISTQPPRCPCTAIRISSLSGRVLPSADRAVSPCPSAASRALCKGRWCLWPREAPKLHCHLALLQP